MEFSDKSKSKLDNIHPDLVAVMKIAIKTSAVDFGITYGVRSDAEQYSLYKKGRVLIDGEWIVTNKNEIVTNADGIQKRSNHQKKDDGYGYAVDIVAYNKDLGYTYDDIHLAYLAGHIMSTAEYMYRNGEIEHNIRWGGNWDGDGTLVIDQKLKDLPHYELIS